MSSPFHRDAGNEPGVGLGTPSTRRSSVLERQPDLTGDRPRSAERLAHGHESSLSRLRYASFFGAVSFEENLAFAANLHERPCLPP